MPQSLAYREWYATRMSGTLRVVSTFYESVIRAMVGGIGPENYGDGDVVTPNYSWVFEVKGATSRNAFRVRSSQLTEHERRVREEFLFFGTAFFYCFFGYSSNESKKSLEQGQVPHSLLRSSVVSGNGYAFLAERTRNLWIVPLPIVRELFDELRVSVPRNQRPLFPPTQDQEPVFGINLYRKDLHTLAERIPTKTGLANVIHHPDNNAGYPTRFRVISFLHPSIQLPKLKGITWD